MRDEFLKTFQNYASSYNLNDPKIYLKYIHTEKVAQNSIRIAESLSDVLDPQDIELAWQLGVLHDIGRFEQLRRYNTFIDSISINHGEFGADLLFCERLIEIFQMDPEQYQTAELAIRSHNRYRIPENLTRREQILCDILRDADKIDIFRVNYETGMEAIYDLTTEELKQSEITPEVYESFMDGKVVLRSLKKAPLDHLVGHISLYFELVFPESRKIAAEQGYIQKLTQFQSENPDTRRKMDTIREKIAEVLEV